MKVYVASRASIPARGQMWRALRDEGFQIVSTWIDEDGPDASPDMCDLWSRIEREVTTAERLVLYAEPEDFPLKGAFVEVGMAIAANVPVIVVAPNVDLEPRSCRPIGSWMMHPIVFTCGDVREALTMALAPAAA